MPIDGQLNLLRMSQMDMEAHHKNSFQFPSHPALANFDSVDVAADANSQARKPLRDLVLCRSYWKSAHKFCCGLLEKLVQSCAIIWIAFLLWALRSILLCNMYGADLSRFILIFYYNIPKLDKPVIWQTELTSYFVREMFRVIYCQQAERWRRLHWAKSLLNMGEIREISNAL